MKYHRRHSKAKETKGMDISKVTDKRITSIKAKINRRPREKLHFSTPKEEFFRVYS